MIPDILDEKKPTPGGAPPARAWLTIAACLVATVLLAGPGRAQTEAYYNIVSVTSEQINNAVRVKLEADGAISANIGRWWSGGAEPDYYLIWEVVAKQTTGEWSPDCYPKVDKIRVHLENALPRVGNVIRVSKYPVSHVRLMTTPEPGARFGLDLEVVLYKPMRLRQFRFSNFGMWDAYLMDHHDPAWFEVVQSPDKRSLIITVATDRLPEVREHRRLADVPQQAGELKVGLSDGLLDIHARNVGLAALLDAVSGALGRGITASDAAGARVVTAELPAITAPEFLERMCQCYGLIVGGAPGHEVLCDILEQSAASQASLKTTAIPVSGMTAGDAVTLLPNFLVECVSVDEEHNALLVSGSEALGGKVAADLARVDQPPTTVSLKATLVEASAAAELTRELGLRYSDDGFELSTDASSGELTYARLEIPASEFEAAVRALVRAQKAKITGESTLTVASGETAVVFSGIDKYIPIRRTSYDLTPVLEAVSAGVELSVTPWAGNRTVTLEVATKANTMGESDPLTGLPVITARAVEGTFRLRPGEMIMIAGLSQRQADSAVRKIPILGDLPVVGALFRSKIGNRAASELVAFLTVTTINSSGDGSVDCPQAGTVPVFLRKAGTVP